MICFDKKQAYEFILILEPIDDIRHPGGGGGHRNKSGVHAS
jgi:hypothetical protein